MQDQLKNLPPFRALDPLALEAVERHASRLQLPARRWLKRRGQSLGREMFLIEGRLAARRGAAIERLDPARTGASINIRAAEATEIYTVTTATLIAVDLKPIRGLLNGAGEVNGEPTVGCIDDWMQALLQGPIMRWFSPDAWARVLRVGKLRQVRRGERIVMRGTVSRHVFVVAQGIAEIAGERYAAGAFFGEESALGQCPAEVDATMATDGLLVCFAREDVVQLAACYDPPHTDPPPRRLDLDAIPMEREGDLLAALPPNPPIAVRSSDPARRLRVAARLMRRGYTVV